MALEWERLFPSTMKGPARLQRSKEIYSPFQNHLHGDDSLSDFIDCPGRRVGATVDRRIHVLSLAENCSQFVQ